MRKFAVLLALMMLVLCQEASGQHRHGGGADGNYTVHLTHATDCENNATGAVQGEMCIDLDDGTVWVCITGDGNCNTAVEWFRRDDTGAGGGDPVLIDGTNVDDSLGVNLIGGAGVLITFNGAASPETASFATASGETNFLASGALTCTTGEQGRMQVHTTALQYCDNAATPTLRYAAYSNSTGDATGLACSGACVSSAEADATFVLDSESLAGDVSGTVGATVVDDVQTATANTEAADNNTTQVATTAFVQQEHAESAGSCTNQVVTAVNADAVPTCSNVTSAMVPADELVAADVAASLDTRKGFHLYIENVAVTDEFVIHLPPFTGTMTRFDCEAFSGTSFTVNLCDGEDIGDDTCTTSVLGNTVVCDTTGANDTTLTNPGFAARDKVSLVVTAVSGTVNGAVLMTVTVD